MVDHVRVGQFGTGWWYKNAQQIYKKDVSSAF